MRWEALFADLEGQLAAAAQADLAAEVADLVRAEWAEVTLSDRLRPLVGATVRVSVTGAGTLQGRLCDLGAGWLLLAESPRQSETLIPTAAVQWVEGLSRRTVPEQGVEAVTRRLGLGHVLRSIARDRSPVLLVVRDGQTVTGTLDRVGADFLEVAVHPIDEPRRAGQVQTVRAVPWSALAAVRRAPG